ncbi:hypothetical protein LCGC14_1478870 [marine sediment metagenome]|uniref:Fucose isomerase n=1 Tax=marine sediment metagenome TaxID=412755 RepID=A0A0F9MBS2_9ZZZZ
MALFTKTTEKPTFGIIVGNRDVFPDKLVKEGRIEMIEVLQSLQYNYVILSENDTKFGCVETYNDAKKCTELFKKNAEKIGGV